MKGVKGYKAFNKDMICRDMQYEVGKEYKMNKKPVICKTGYHFCKSIADCYNFYNMSADTIICEIKALGEVVSEDSKTIFCTNHIRIIKKVSNPREKSNISANSSGYCNIGNRNSGHWNSGNCNSGDSNSGNHNNSDHNSGDSNDGFRNSGNRNSGHWNSGNRNSGDRNSGDHNSGDSNSGICNSGNCNSGGWNSGNYNSGDWNSGDRNSGVFCTEKNPRIKLFDQESDWTMSDWQKSKARDILSKCPHTHSDFIRSNDMTNEEKKQHPEHKTIGGYIKTIVATNEDKQKWWDGLDDADKNIIYELPNFNAEKFRECTGISVVNKSEIPTVAKREE